MVSVLQDIVIVFLIASVVLGLCHRLHIPSIVGLLVTGVVIGPYGTGMFVDQQAIGILAEFGIVLLMFSIGLDFDRDRVRELRRTFGVGTYQILFCIIGGFVLAYLIMGENWSTALMLGFLIAHTSSTLLLKIYQDQGELSTPPARLSLGISVTQDLSSVFMLLLIPFLAVGTIGTSQIQAAELDLLRSVGMVGLVAVVVMFLVPRVIKYVVKTKNREFLLFFLFLLCLGAAWAAGFAGLSAALGAFVAGLAVARTEYSYQVHAEVAPLRDLLVSLFFISVGMLVDLRILPDYLHIVLPLLVFILVIKFLSGAIPVAMAGYPLRIAVLTGVAIAQIGEFSFVLAFEAKNFGIITEQQYQPFIITGILSMMVSPFLVKFSPKLYELISYFPMPKKLHKGTLEVGESDKLAKLENHVVIAGYGLNGRNLVRSLHSLDIPYVALEMSPENVASAQREKKHVYFGDCTRLDVLRRLNIKLAKVFVIAISDLEATRRAVQITRHESSLVHIIVRTRYVEEIGTLLKLGANEVIPEEFETSLEVLAKTLHKFQISRATVDELVVRFREDKYKALRTPLTLPVNKDILTELSSALEIDALRVEPDSKAAGKQIKDLSLPQVSGAVILGVRRQGSLVTPPSSNMQLEENDTVLLAGTHKQLVDSEVFFKTPPGPDVLAHSQVPSES